MSAMYQIDIDFAQARVKASNCEQFFAHFSATVAPRILYSKDTLLDHLLLQESRSGSGIGEGVAVAQLKLPGIRKRFVALMTLDRPVEFETPDDVPVDIVCVLLSPESDGPVHLRGLSRITRLLKNRSLCQRLRETRDADAIRALFVDPEGWLLAA